MSKLWNFNARSRVKYRGQNLLSWKQSLSLDFVYNLCTVKKSPYLNQITQGKQDRLFQCVQLLINKIVNKNKSVGKLYLDNTKDSISVYKTHLNFEEVLMIPNAYKSF